MITQEGIIILAGVQSLQNIDLSELKGVDEVYINEDIKFLLSERKINRAHVSHLVSSNPHDWPSLKVAHIKDMRNSTNNYSIVEYYLVIDGRHRLEAARKKNLSTLSCEVKSYADMTEMIEDILSSNLRHGLPATTKQRAVLAIWLYLNDTDNNMTIEYIADECNLSVSTVRRAIKKATQEDGPVDTESNAYKQGLRIARYLTSSLNRSYNLQTSVLRRYTDEAVRNDDINGLAEDLLHMLDSVRHDKVKHLKMVYETFRDALDIVLNEM